MPTNVLRSTSRSYRSLIDLRGHSPAVEETYRPRRPDSFRRAQLGSLLPLVALIAFTSQSPLKAEYTIEQEKVLTSGLSTRFQLIRAQREHGQIADALAGLKVMMQKDLVEPTRRLVRLELLGILVEQEAEKPTAERQWQTISKSFNSLADEYPNDPSIAVLRLAIFVAERGSADKSELIGKIEALEARFSDSPAFWTGAADLYARLQEPRRAERAQARRESLLLRSASTLASRIDSAEAGPTASEQKETNARYEEIHGYMVEVRRRLAIGDIETAVNKLREWNRRFPRSTQPQEMLSQIYTAQRSAADLESFELRLLRGQKRPSNLVRRIRTNRLLLQAELGDVHALTAVTKEIQRWLLEKRELASAHAFAAQAFEISGEFDKAIVSYRSAIEHGNRDPGVTRSLLGLLHMTDRTAEAVELISRLDSQTLHTPQVFPLAVQLVGLTGRRQEALRISREAIDQSPNSLHAHDALARAYLTLPDGEEASRLAVAPLQEARRIQGSNPIHWGANLWVLLQQDQRPLTGIARTAHRSAALFESYGGRLPANWKRLLVARSLEVSGDLKGAELQYRTLRQTSQNPAILRWIPQGSFVTRLAAPARTQDDSGSGKDVVIGEPLDDGSLEPAVAQTCDLVQAFLNPAAFDAANAFRADTRLQSIAVLAGDSSDRRGAATKRLLSLTENERTASDYVFLARLARFDQSIDAVQGYYEQALKSAPSQEDLKEIFDIALSFQKVNLAAQALAAMDGSESAEIQAMKFRLLVANDRIDDATLFASRAIENLSAPQRPRATLQFARLMANAGLDDAALTIVDRNLSASPSYDVATTQLLAGMKNRQKQAMKRCAALERTGQAGTASMLAIRAAQIAPQDKNLAAQVDGMIARLDDNERRAGGFLIYLAQLRELQGRMREAASIANEVIAVNPGDYGQVNNLAWILAAYDGEGSESLELSNQAVRGAGPLDAFLDTKSQSLIAMDRVDEALRLLELLVTTCDSTRPSISQAVHLLDAKISVTSDAQLDHLREWIASDPRSSTLGPHDAAIVKREIQDRI